MTSRKEEIDKRRWRAVIGMLAVGTVLLWVGKPARAQQAPTFSVLYTFTGGTDGANPQQKEPLVLDKDGNLYGTTYYGGDLSASVCYYIGCGVVFRVSPAGKETVLYSFTGGTDGGYPYAGLAQDRGGNLYGTTSGAGAYGGGVVFRVEPDGKETVLYSFSFLGPDGSDPDAGLILDQEGNLYGTTEAGGNLSACPGSGCGVVFKLDPTGNESVLHAFNNGADGNLPQARPFQDKEGNLYGTTWAGGYSGVCAQTGSAGCGVVFKVQPGGTETVLYRFTGGADGSAPFAALIEDPSGNLYGTTYWGGDLGGCNGAGCGTVFRLTPTAKETVLYSFLGEGSGGGQPQAAVIRDKEGNLYGTTQNGGAYQDGTVFKLDPSGKVTTLYSFTGGTDGGQPYAGLVQDKEGNLYGLTSLGGNTSSTCPYGSEGCGVVFKITLR